MPPRVLTLDITPYAPLLHGSRYIGADIGNFVQAGWHVTVDFDLNERTDEASPKKPADGIAALIFESGGAVTTPRQVTIPSDAQQVFGRIFMSGANTSSCQTVPVKLESGAFLVGRAADRMILSRMFCPPWVLETMNAA